MDLYLIVASVLFYCLGKFILLQLSVIPLVTIHDNDDDMKTVIHCVINIIIIEKERKG